MEIWVPYGDVEVLLNLQAENLGELVEAKSEPHSEAIVERLGVRFKESSRVVLCDNRSPTIKILQGLVRKNPPPDGLRVVTPFPREVEQRVPEVKGMVMKFQETRERILERPNEVSSPSELLDDSTKLFLGTAIPDPLVGVVDSVVGIALLVMGGARKVAYTSRESDDPATLTRNRSYDALENLTEKIPNGHFATIFTRGGEPSGLIEGPAIDDAKANFQTVSVAPTKAIIVAPGGRGYDGTLSQAIRLLWNVVDVVKKSGEILLVSECREGVGSEALQMVATGRISGDALKKGTYADGAEEISYINRLKQDYSITLLSSLPELYSGTRLRFKTATSGVDAVNKVLNSAGRTTKFHVVPRLGETILSRSQ